MTKHAFAPGKEWTVPPATKRPPAKKVGVAKKTAKAGAAAAAYSAHGGIKTPRATKTGTYRDLVKTATRIKAEPVDDTGPLAAIHSIAQAMFEVGGISKKTMREYDELCVPKVPMFSKTTIAKIRKDAKVSQALFAKFLNTSASTVQQWETGVKKPSGAAAKLLQIVAKHGIEVLG